MKMSANENESVDIRLNANRRSNLIDLEELNRMERPSRVFSSRHHLSIPPALTETNNMEQNEQFRRSRDHSNSNYFENSSSSTRIGGSIANGDAARNRSPFVRFTITDPETQQITVAGQIPLNNTPPNTQTSSVASVNDISDGSIHDESDDEALNLYYWRNNIDQISSYNNSMSHAIRQLRNSRSGRRSRRFTDHPYFMRNNLDNNPSNNRTIHRRVRFSSTNRGYNDHFPDRSQTPEQELPEVLEHVMEPDNQYDEVYQSPDSMTSVSSHNDADFGDDRGSPHFSVSENHNTNADEENRDGTLDVSNETPRTRVVPFIMSPTPFSPPHESPPDTPEIPVTRINNDLLNVTRSTRRRLPLIMNDEVENDEIFNHGLALPLPDYTIPGPSQFRCVVSSGILNNDNGSVSRTIDVELNNTENEPVNNSVRIDEIVDSANEDNNETILTNPHSTLTCAMHSNDQATEETSPIHVEEHPETYVDLNVQLLLLFECPVCFEHIIPPIFQCLLGHLICNKCVLMCENCPTCRNPFNSKRNLYMEKVCYLVKFPCINASTGCKLQMFVGQKEVHEKECCYRHYHCFFSNCSWRGYYPELRTHAINYHSNYVLTGSEQSLDIMLPNNNQTYQWFLLSHNECFAVIVHSSKSPKRVKLQVNFVGPAVKAKQFKFSVLLTQNKDHCDMPQKLMYERSTLPYSTVYEMLTNNGLKKKDIFSLPGEMLGPFIKKRRHCLPIILKVGPVSDL